MRDRLEITLLRLLRWHASVLCLLAAASIPARATILFSNITGPCCGGYTVAGVDAGGGPDVLAVEFTAPFDSVLVDARVVVQGEFGSGDHSFDMALWSDAAGLPSLRIEDLGALTAPTDALGAIVTGVSTLRPSLMAGTSYWLVLSPVSTESGVIWEMGGSSNAPGALYHPVLLQWLSLGGQEIQFEINGDPVPEPATFLVCAPLLAAFFVGRRRKLW